MLLAGLSGCMTPQSGPKSTFNQAGKARELTHVQGPMGTPVAVGANGLAQQPVTQANYRQTTTLPNNGIVQANGFGAVPGGYNGQVSDLPKFKVHNGIVPVPAMGPPGAVAMVNSGPYAGMGAPLNARTSVRFAEPAGMKVSWYGPNGLNEIPLETPARYNFLQGAPYRLKVWGIQNQPGLELYPTIEVVPATPKTATYLAHSSVPVTFSDEDFAQVASGNFLVKVIYLPDPAYQDISTVAGPSEVVSSRLEPGADPIVEAQKRGSILLIIRMGNIDLQAPNTPAMNAPSPFGGAPVSAMPAPVQQMPNMAPPALMAMPAPMPSAPPSVVGPKSSTGTVSAPPLNIPAPSMAPAPSTGTAPPLVLPKATEVPAIPTSKPNTLPNLN